VEASLWDKKVSAHDGYGGGKEGSGWRCGRVRIIAKEVGEMGK
jgi:hypothetical protein